MSKRTRKSVANACDVLWSNAVRLRANGRCEYCGESGRLEAHHIHSRTDRRLRWELRNGCALHHQCHRWAEGHPLEFAEWFKTHRPDDVEFLREERAKGPYGPRTLGDYLLLEQQLKNLIDEVTGLAA